MMTNANSTELSNNDYAEFYKLRKEASTMNTVTLNWLKDFFENSESFKCLDNTNISILSVGPGEGDLDLEIIKSIQKNLKHKEKSIDYYAIEPNPLHSEKFSHNFSREMFPNTTRLSLENGSFENFYEKNGKNFDIILFIQVMYYFKNPEEIIRKAYAHLNPKGKAIIVNQSHLGIPEIQKDHMLDLTGNLSRMYTSLDIKKTLKRLNITSYSHSNLNSYLNFSEESICSEKNLKILSFCMECNLNIIPQDKISKLVSTLKSKLNQSKHENSLYEPTTIFVIDKNIKTQVTRSSFDHDPVDDYRQLATRFDWKKEISSISEANCSQQSFKILDVACGTGRWIKAFNLYVREKVSTQISYDFLDLSKKAMEEAREYIKKPMIKGNEFPYKLQDAPLQRGQYDLIWSLHGFYAIPESDLKLSLDKICSSLKPNGKAFIAQASKASFYVDFYETYLKTTGNKKKNSFTSAEQLTKALKTKELEYKCHVIAYHEVIHKEEKDRLANYILKEAIHNSFDSAETGRSELPQQTHLECLFEYHELKQYVEALRKGDEYYFPEEIWLIEINAPKNP